DIIQSQLNMIQESRQVRILYALESGSRAWGFLESIILFMPRAFNFKKGRSFYGTSKKGS
ncbi:MAG TPA: nucleotidyltransferase domain-containing protein, partial [Desulfatirhabdiaceae bacterium]|nr:nucleotidyltransferase domain-containing protein [Desulfatirhabdiaceae bacterium]